MTKEMKLLAEALEWMEELKYVWSNSRDSGDYDLLDLIVNINTIEQLLTQPEQEQKSKVDFQTLTEMGLKRLQVSDELVLQEGCSISPTLILAENGNVIEIITFKKLLEIRSFIDAILNYTDTPPTREPLSDDEISNLYYNVNGAIHKFARAIEQAHGITGVDDE